MAPYSKFQIKYFRFEDTIGTITIIKETKKKKWQFWIDRGGTFTDVIGVSPENVLHVEKLLTAQKEESFELVLKYIYQVIQLNRQELLMDELVEEIKIGTTIGTNALLENKGAKTALLVTTGYKDLLEIGHQNRQYLFSLNICHCAFAPEPTPISITCIGDRLKNGPCVISIAFHG